MKRRRSRRSFLRKVRHMANMAVAWILLIAMAGAVVLAVVSLEDINPDYRTTTGEWSRGW